MLNSRLLGFASLVLAGVVVAVPQATAGETVKAAVSIPAGQPEPLVTYNGNAVPPGAYSVGTLRLEYDYVGFNFPEGTFAEFDLNLALAAGNGGPTNYNAPLTLGQSGSPNMVLTPTPAAFTVTGPSWTDTAIIQVAIPHAVAINPLLNVDGTVLVGNMQLASPGRSGLGTATSVQVKIRLVYPTSCLRQYTFLSDRDISADVGSVVMSYGTRGGNVDKIMNMSPVSANALAQVVLLVNTCAEDHLVDLRVAPDARLVFGPGNGNTTFVYSGPGELAPGAIDTASLVAVSASSHVVSITNLNIKAGESVLVKLHLVLDGSLTRNTIGSSPFVLGSTAFLPGGTFTSLDTEVDPNPATRNVTFSLVPQN